MRRFVLMLAAALTVAGPMAAAAPPARAATAEETRIGNQMNQFIVELGAYSEPYRASLNALYTQIEKINAGAATAVEFNNGGRAEEGRRWAQTWSAERRAEIQAARQQLAAVSVRLPDTDRLDPALRNNATIRTLVRAVGTIPAISRTQFDALEAVALKYVAVVAAAAGGDEESLVQLHFAIYELYTSMLTSEIAMLESVLPTLEATNAPSEETTIASIETDRGIIVVYELMIADLNGQAPDRRAGAARIRASAARIDKAVVDLGPKLATARRQFPPGQYGALGVKVRAVADSLDESRIAYTELAGRFRSLADTIEAGTAFDAEAVTQALEAGQPAIDRIISIEERRQAIAAH